MATIRDIQKRIKSIGSTKKVTHAMELVAAAKMRKSQSATLSSRPYSQNLHEVLQQVQKRQDMVHDLLRENDAAREMVIIISSDRGLAGGLNINLFREIAKGEFKNAIFVTVGAKAAQFAAKTQGDLTASFGSEEVPFLDLARNLSKLAIDAFINKEVSKVKIIYPHFESTVNQAPKWIQLLPILPIPAADIQEDLTNNLLFEPSTKEIVDIILPHHLLTEIYQVLLEAKASEHSARMVAMKNATDAAGDLIDDLTLTYNQVRQEAITKELLDITTAQKAFE